MYRQGDVLLIPVKVIPAKAKPKPKVQRVTLALGEVTGHAHVLEATDSAARTRTKAKTIEPFTVEDQVDVTFLRIMQDAFLKHDEHAPLAIPAGTYQVIRQVEYTPAAIVRVAD